MKKILPYPLLFASLLLFWLLLNGFTRAQLLLGAIIAIAACLIMTALQPQKNHIRSIPTMLWLFGAMSYDILHSNIAVAGSSCRASASGVRASSLSSSIWKTGPRLPFSPA